MVLLTFGAEQLVRLMALDADPRPDLSWLLFGPTDPAVVEPPERREPPAFLMAAE